MSVLVEVMRCPALVTCHVLISVGSPVVVTSTSSPGCHLFTWDSPESGRTSTSLPVDWPQVLDHGRLTCVALRVFTWARVLICSCAAPCTSPSKRCLCGSPVNCLTWGISKTLQGTVDGDNLFWIRVRRFHIFCDLFDLSHIRNTGILMEFRMQV